MTRNLFDEIPPDCWFIIGQYTTFETMRTLQLLQKESTYASIIKTISIQFQKRVQEICIKKYSDKLENKNEKIYNDLNLYSSAIFLGGNNDFLSRKTNIGKTTTLMAKSTHQWPLNNDKIPGAIEKFTIFKKNYSTTMVDHKKQKTGKINVDECLHHNVYVGMFSIDEPETLKHIDSLFWEINKWSPMCTKILVANKMDLVVNHWKDRYVQREEALNIYESHQSCVAYLEISAICDVNINELFDIVMYSTIPESIHHSFSKTKESCHIM
jgi:hypothetical protein